MNPLTNMKNVTKLSERELQNNSKSSWHDQYRDSAWIFIGGLPYDLTEGDIICIFSQYGEVVNINLIRDKDTGKSKGYCFLCYEDQRSTVLAVDNFNGIKVLNRILRVDHVSEYKIPKEGKKTDEETKKLYNEGCAPKPIKPSAKNFTLDDIEYRRETLADQIQADIKLPARLPIYTVKKENQTEELINIKTDKKTKRGMLKNHSDSEDNDKTSREDNYTKKKKHSKKKYSNSESDPDSETETFKKQQSSSRSSSLYKNEKYRDRSRSPKEKRRDRQYKEHEDTKKSRSGDRNEYKNSLKHSDSRRHDKHRRQSRS